MPEILVRFTFAKTASMEEVEGTLHLARLAVESLHGKDRVRLDAKFAIDRTTHTCMIDAACEVGRALAMIFAGYVRREFGDGAVRMERAGVSGKGEVAGAVA
jgi:hypothetical protein